MQLDAEPVMNVTPQSAAQIVADAVVREDALGVIARCAEARDYVEHLVDMTLSTLEAHAIAEAAAQEARSAACGYVNCIFANVQVSAHLVLQAMPQREEAIQKTIGELGVALLPAAQPVSQPVAQPCKQRGGDPAVRTIASQTDSQSVGRFEPAEPMLGAVT